jgi:hypothetical protein
MVASAGAGPEPIPQKAITVERLVEAIEFCSTPQAAEAAASIASKMQSEQGVKQAVTSFHKHLRPYVVECDIIKGRPAVWEYSRRRNTIKLSKLAADILMTHLKIDGNKLKQIETRKIIIETRRWDPLTGLLAALLGATTDVTTAAVRAVKQPVRTLSRRDQHDQSDELNSIELGRTNFYIRPKESRSCLAVTKSAVLAFVLGLGTLVKAIATAIVEIPFAFTEGLWQFPRIWGHQVRDFGVIRDWKAGLATWLQVLVFAFYDGLAGLFVQPYLGAKEDGPLGAFKGIAKAIANLSFMLLAGTCVTSFQPAEDHRGVSNIYCGTAAVGTGAYPLRGVHQSILYLIYCQTRRSVQLARRLEGRYLAGKAGTDRVLEHEVLDSFDKLMQREAPRHFMFY